MFVNVKVQIILHIYTYTYMYIQRRNNTILNIRTKILSRIFLNRNLIYKLKDHASRHFKIIHIVKVWKIFTVNTYTNHSYITAKSCFPYIVYELGWLFCNWDGFFPDTCSFTKMSRKYITYFIITTLSTIIK